MARTAAVRRAPAADFAATFRQLKAILEPYADRLRVAQDKPHNYYLEVKDKFCCGKPVFFASVRSGKAYVSFHLFPLYICPEMAAGISPQLKKRMQGKTCFNFTAPDAPLFAELSRLTADGLKRLKAVKLPE